MNSFKKIIIILIIIFSSLVQGKKNKYKNNYIYIKNNVLLMKVNKFNGNIHKIKLLKYEDSELIKKITNKINTTIYKIKKNNFNKQNIYFQKKNVFYNKKYIKILWKNKKNNIIYSKYIILDKDSYKFYLNFEIKNNTNKIIYYKIYYKLINFENNFNNINNVSFLNKNDKFEKYNLYEDKNKKKFNTELNWISISEKNFSTILIPEQNNTINNLYINNKKKNNITKYVSTIKIKPKEIKIIKYKLWTGPNLTKDFSNLSNKLDLNIDYGKLWFITKPILRILIYINKITNNWGYSIIIITIIFKIITYPLNKIQDVILNKIKYVQPKIENIKVKYKNKKQKISKKIIYLYKKYEINPIMGFVLIIVQIPLFISLYNIISQITEFKNAKFLFWIKDLSSYDKYYILPLLMGISMLLTQKQNNYNINMFLTPIIFVILSLHFPSGVLLYYTINNLITFIQQKIW